MAVIYANINGVLTGIPMLTGKSAYQSALDSGYVGSEIQFNIDLTSVSSKLDITKRWELSSSQTVITITGATISPDFTYAIYKADVNYAGGVSVAWTNGVNYHFPTSDSCVVTYLKNTNGTDRLFSLQTSTYTYNSIVYTFLDMSGGTLTLPTGKVLEISYLFIYDSATTCRVEILTKIQA